jgi:membrane protease YdiL (CAAX protease family)
MVALERLAAHRPLSFSLLIALLVLVSYVATGILANVVTEGRAGYERVEAVGRVAASLFFLYLLWRLGWLAPSRVTVWGSLSAWAVALVVLAYDLVTTTYALFGSVSMPGLSDPVLSASAAANALATGLIEEIPFRGLILYALLRHWGNTRRGTIVAVLYSSLLFGGIHVVHILFGRPVPQAILVAVSATLTGIVYAALVLRLRTIWTAVALHGVTNAVVTMRALEMPGYAEPVSGLGLLIAFQLPLVAYGAYLIYKIPSRPVTPDAA